MIVSNGKSHGTLPKFEVGCQSSQCAFDMYSRYSVFKLQTDRRAFVVNHGQEG